jgi:hypothetical protein
MRVVCLAALVTALGLVSGCREEAMAPFSPRFLPHDGGVDASQFDPPSTGASNSSGGGPAGTSIPTVSDEGCVSSFSDSFNAGINSAVWTTEDACAATVTAAGDQVRMRINGGCFSQPHLRLNRGRLCGDFDVSVDYRLPDWNPLAAGERWATLLAHEPGTSNAISIERVGGDDVTATCREEDVHIGWADATSTCDADERGEVRAASGISARLRIARKDGTVSAYVGNTLLAEGDEGLEPMQLFLVAGTTGAPHLVFWDNITVSTSR